MAQVTLLTLPVQTLAPVDGHIFYVYTKEYNFIKRIVPDLKTIIIKKYKK